MESRNWAQAQVEARARLERQSSEQVDRAIARAQEQAIAQVTLKYLGIAIFHIE